MSIVFPLHFDATKWRKMAKINKGNTPQPQIKPRSGLLSHYRALHILGFGCCSVYYSGARARGKEVRSCRCYDRQELLTGELCFLKARTVQQSATYTQGAHARTHMHGRTRPSKQASFKVVSHIQYGSILLITYVYYCAYSEMPE